MLAGNIVGKTRTLPLAVYSEVMSGNYDNAGVYVFIIRCYLFDSCCWCQCLSILY